MHSERIKSIGEELGAAGAMSLSTFFQKLRPGEVMPNQLKAMALKKSSLLNLDMPLIT